MADSGLEFTLVRAGALAEDAALTGAPLQAALAGEMPSRAEVEPYDLAFNAISSSKYPARL